MKTTRQHPTNRRTTALALTALFATVPLTADSVSWNGGTGNWSDTTKWTPNSAPSSGDTATISGTAASQTVTYDAAASGLLGTLSLGQGNAGTTNSLIITKSLTVGNDINLGGSSSLGTAILQLGSGPASVPTLKIASGGTSGTLTIGQNATYVASGAPGGPIIDANITLNTGGKMTLNTAATTDTRTIILGNFTATGGTIERVAGNAGQGILQLKGSTNTINSVTLSGSPFIYLNGTGDQSLSTNVTIANLAFRATTGTKTLSGTGTIGTLHIGNYTTTTNLKFALGSDLTSTNGFADGSWGGAAGATLALETNGHNFNVTNNLNFLVGNAPSGTWNISNSQSAPSSIAANNILFNSNSTYSITGPLTIEARTGSINPNSATISVGSDVTLKSNSAFDLTAAAAANTTIAAGATIHNTGAVTTNLGNRNGLKFRYTGSAGGLSSTGTVASIEVGDGTNTSKLTRANSNLTALAGTLKINTNATYDSSGWSTTLGGNLAGNGTYHAINSNGSVTWSSGSTGGFSAGDGLDKIGTFHMSAANSVSGTPTVTLLSTSVSTFDIASISSFDVVDLGAFNIKFGGTLELNFLGSYEPNANDSFQLFTQTAELNSSGTSFVGTMAGSFTNITSNLTGYKFAFDATTGLLKVTAIPEPATVMVIVGLAALAGAVAWKRRTT